MNRVVWFLLFLSFSSFGQQNNLSIHSYYKDQLFKPSIAEKYSHSSFLPIRESQVPLLYILRDSSKQYYWITQKLYKEHLFEIQGDGYQINLSPLADISVGRDFGDTSSRKLFNNTRGILIEVDLFGKLSLSTSYYENQNRFTNYETDYYKTIGERYPDEDSTYHIENAIVPGSARTKPFKDDGFDYGYAIGNVVYAPNKSLSFSMGNNHSFVGNGYRSLFLSDNSVPSTYFRTDIQLKNKIHYTIYRSKQFNLLRRPFRTTVEAYYEPKLYSSQYLEIPIGKKVRFSLFEGSMWSLGDSVTYRPVDGAYFVPIPFVANTIVNNSNLIQTIHGVQLSTNIQNVQVYSQLAISNWSTEKAAFQIGFRWYDWFKIPETFLQFEFNEVPTGVYNSSNARINYTNYNLPFAHPKGQGFREIIGRVSYTKKRFYLDLKSVFYEVQDYVSGDLVVANENTKIRDGNIFIQQSELGYRFNTKLNLCGFVRHLSRTATYEPGIKTSAVMVGIATNLIHHYNDF